MEGVNLVEENDRKRQKENGVTMRARQTHSVRNNWMQSLIYVFPATDFNVISSHKLFKLRRDSEEGR